MTQLFVKNVFLASALVLLSNTATAQQSAMEKVREAKTQTHALSPTQVSAAIADTNVVLIDVRDAEELSKGKIKGSVHASRGMLEFYADSTVSYYKPVFKKDKTIILYCTSSGRSALAAKTLQEMGYKNVYQMEGGLNAWEKAGLPIEKP